MHSFHELLESGVQYSLKAYNQLNDTALDSLDTSASTSSVKALQIVNLNYIILSIGMFSLLESTIQDEISCENADREIQNVLLKLGRLQFLEKYKIYKNAINTLKHGKGSSYNSLQKNANNLPFNLKLAGKEFFDEGDVSELIYLTRVDNIFVLECLQVIVIIYKLVLNNNNGYKLYDLTEEEIKIVEGN